MSIRLNRKPPAFTPGRWSLPFVTERPIAQEVFGDDGRIAMIELPGNSRHDEQVANARLIAAAPELFAACQYVADLTGCALSKEQAEILGKRCKTAIEVALTGKGVRNV